MLGGVDVLKLCSAARRECQGSLQQTCVRLLWEVGTSDAGLAGCPEALSTSDDTFKHLHGWSTLLVLALSRVHQPSAQASVPRHDLCPKLTLSRRSRVA